ncbi:MAG: hypothetical protein P8Z78_02025 [Gammaproteobacteria bacterium]
MIVFRSVSIPRLVVLLMIWLALQPLVANAQSEVGRQISAAEGGELAITNKAGDIVRLTIPPGALPAPQEIRLVSNDTPVANPLSDRGFAGVSIYPQALVLQKPALLDIQPAEPLASGSMLFRVAAPELVIPMGDSRSSEIAQDPEEKAIELDTKSSALSGDSGSYENEVFRGGTYITGVPSNQEAQEQSKRLIEIPPLSYPDWQGAKEQIRGILEWAERDMLAGDGAEADVLIERARDIAGKVIREFLEVPEPTNPCDESYYQLLFQLAELGMLGLTHDMPKADEEFQNRIQTVINHCTLRFELEIDYRRRVDDWVVQEEVRAIGVIPLSFRMDLADTDSPIRGHGEVSLTSNGRVGDCSQTAVGSGDVDVTGRFDFDKHGLPIMRLTLRHDITATYTLSCPEGTGSKSGLRMFRDADQTIEFEFAGDAVNKSFGWFDLTWTLQLIDATR